jgi:phage shock protein C
MIRITDISSLSAEPLGLFRRRPVLDLHPFVDYQCCAAISRLQHKVEIPNSRVRKWRGLRTCGLVIRPNHWNSITFSFGTALAKTRAQDLPTEFVMDAQVNQPALPLRNHNILGVCEAIGEDFGFNPVLLRIPFAASVLWSPLMAIGAYFALGGIVLLSRLVFPKAKTAAPSIEEARAIENVEPKLPLAA